MARNRQTTERPTDIGEEEGTHQMPGPPPSSSEASGEAEDWQAPNGQAPDYFGPEVKINSIGTAKRKEGDSFEPYVNLSCEVQVPNDQAFLWLYKAKRTGQALYVGAKDVVTVSKVATKGKNRDIAVTLVARNPGTSALRRFYGAFCDEDELPVREAQGSFGEPME